MNIITNNILSETLVADTFRLNNTHVIIPQHILNELIRCEISCHRTRLRNEATKYIDDNFSEISSIISSNINIQFKIDTSKIQETVAKSYQQISSNPYFEEILRDIISSEVYNHVRDLKSKEQIKIKNLIHQRENRLVKITWGYILKHLTMNDNIKKDEYVSMITSEIKSYKTFMKNKALDTLREIFEGVKNESHIITVQMLTDKFPKTFLMFYVTESMVKSIIDNHIKKMYNNILSNMNKVVLGRIRYNNIIISNKCISEYNKIHTGHNERMKEKVFYDAIQYNISRDLLIKQYFTQNTYYSDEDVVENLKNININDITVEQVRDLRNTYLGILPFNSQYMNVNINCSGENENMIYSINGNKYESKNLAVTNLDVFDKNIRILKNGSILTKSKGSQKTYYGKNEYVSMIYIDHHIDISINGLIFVKPRIYAFGKTSIAISHDGTSWEKYDHDFKCKVQKYFYINVYLAHYAYYVITDNTISYMNSLTHPNWICVNRNNVASNSKKIQPPIHLFTNINIRIQKCDWQKFVAEKHKFKEYISKKQPEIKTVTSQNSTDVEAGYLYLIQPGDYLGSDVYKIGMTLREIESRMSEYQSPVEKILVYKSQNVKPHEIALIKMFTVKFGKPVKGREYFKGNINEMIDIFNSVTNV